VNENINALNYPREVLVTLGPPAMHEKINSQVTIKFNTYEEYKEFEDNVVVALNNHPTNRNARRYVECIIESAYKQKYGSSIDSRTFAFVFNNDFISLLSEGSQSKHRRGTDSPVSKPNVSCKAGACGVSDFEKDIGNSGEDQLRCRTCGTYEGDNCYLTEEVIAQKIAAEANHRRSMGGQHKLEVKDARKLVRWLIKDELAKPPKSKWPILLMALIGGALSEIIFRYFF
jgi:hypothetical protein